MDNGNYFRRSLYTSVVQQFLVYQKQFLSKKKTESYQGLFNV